MSMTYTKTNKKLFYFYLHKHDPDVDEFDLMADLDLSYIRALHEIYGNE